MSHESWSSKWFGSSRRVLPILIAVAVTASAAEARERFMRPQVGRAATAFDGRWGVLVRTERGPCEPSLRYGVDIVDGTVTHEGAPYGRVTPSGSVRVELSMAGRRAEGVGRLSGGSGSGVWRGVGQSGVCTGRWVAERRDATYGAGR